MAGTPTPPTSRGRPDVDAARALYQRHADGYDLQTDWAGPDRARAVDLLGLRPGDTVAGARFRSTHDVPRSWPTLAAVVGRLKPGGRVAAVGPMWAPWWAPAMNLLVWYVTSDYVTTFGGLSQPWSHLAALVPGLEVERHDLAGEYFVWGSV